MKNLKSIIIYGAILLLCVAAFGGYFLNKKSSPAAPAPAASAQPAESSGAKAAESTEPKSEEKGGKKEEAKDAKTAEAPTVPMLKDGDNITGKSDEERQKHIQQVMKRELEALDPNPVVGIGRGEDFAKVTADAVTNAGGMKNIIKKGDVVLIKPNICIPEMSGKQMTTDYRVVQQVINMAKEFGAARVIVAEGNFSSNAFEFKDNQYHTLKDAEFFNFNDCSEKDCYELKPQKSVVGKAIFVPKVYMDADVVISVPKLKTHFLTSVSLGLKNAIGIPSYKIYGTGGDKSGLHNLGLDKVIIDLNKIRKPDFVIIDGIIGGEGYGPTNNTPVKSNIVLAGKDVVAVDTTAITFMGFSTKYNFHLNLAIDEKLGIGDISKIKVKGADLKAIQMHFKSASH